MQTPPLSANDAISTAVNGLLRSENDANKAAGNIAQGVGDNTASDIIALNQAANSFAANAQVLNVVSETTRRLVDIFA